MMKCGLLGRKLVHSFSPQIHGMLCDYEYELFEKEEDELKEFFKDSDWHGINVTIPYKRSVIPFLSEMSDMARRAGSVNTIIKREDGSFYGDNTDVYGFMMMVEKAGIDVKGKKALILGSGGASGAVMTALETMGAVPVIISRTGENNYSNLYLHEDARIIVNTTPVGMYPDTGKAALDLKVFPDCEGVIDIIYNPARTELLLQAEELGIPCVNGLYMLIAQAYKSAEMFAGHNIEESKIDVILDELTGSMQNIILVGMPGCGKSTMASKLGAKLGLIVKDADDEITKAVGRKPSQIITEDGEAAFRDIESEVIADLGKGSRMVIATGGGAVLRECNYRALHQNGIIVWLRRDTEKLPTGDRPLSAGHDLNAMYEKREPLYKKFADVIVDNDGTPDETVCRIIREIKKVRGGGAI